MFKIGIQLYTIRDEVERDIRNSLRRISSIGYSGIEFAFCYGGMKPEELGALVEESGLECTGIYAGIRQALSIDSAAYAYAEAMNCRYIISGITGMVSEEEWPSAVGMVKDAAAAAESAGMEFLYHNHWQEFEKIGGKYGLDILFEETDPEKVKFELDTGWLVKAGINPAEYMEKYSGRLPGLHVRDFRPDFEAAELGQGLVDIPSAAAAARRAGVRWLIFEQSIGTFENAAASYRFLDELNNSLEKEQ